MQIVIAWKSTRVNGLKGMASPFLSAVIWLNDGTEQDKKNAESYAEMERKKDDGAFAYRVFAFENEGNPLNRAKAELVAG